MDKQTLREKLSDVFSEVPEIRLGYLFGSQVEGETGPLSDVDVGLLMDRDLDSETLRARLTHRIVNALGGKQVDVVFLNQAPIELSYAVIAQGSCVYQRDVAGRVEFEAQVMSRYGDYLPVLRNHRKDILQGVSNERRVQRYREALRRTERTLSQITAAER